MKRVLLALAALLFWLPAFAQAAPSVRHAVAANARVCRAGSVRLGSGLCCPRSGVTPGGGCVYGAIRPDIVPPPLAFCPSGTSRDAFGRCPTQACMHGYSRDRFGQCQRVVACADGRLRNALGQCPPVIATPRVGVSTICLGGQPPLTGGVCPPLFLCSNGYAPVAGRCARGATLSLTRSPVHSLAPLSHPAISTPVAPLVAPRLATPHFPASSALARPHLVAPRLLPSPALASPHLAPAPLFHSAEPPALAAPHLAPLAPAPHFAPAAPAAGPHLL